MIWFAFLLAWVGGAFFGLGLARHWPRLASLPVGRQIHKDGRSGEGDALGDVGSSRLPIGD